MASVFFSYSHKDEGLRDELEAHLALMKHQGLIDAWHDRRIVAGNEVDDSIFEKLETADIILLLVSSDFTNSTYCFSREMMRALERHEAGEAKVIPVILRHCDWHSSPFGKLMAAPRDGKPVVTWPDKDDALADVAKQVRRAVESLNAGSPMPAASARKQIAMSSGVTLAPAANSMSNVLPRSSNLRLKKEFTEKDRDDFVRATFEFICRFFEGSLKAISERNPEVAGTFDRIDSRRMAAILYRDGKKIAECSVRQDGLARSDGIAFSYDASAKQGSYNELLSVEASEQSLHLKPMGMSWHGGGRDAKLTEEGAAEFLWDLMLKNARS